MTKVYGGPFFKHGVVMHETFDC